MVEPNANLTPWSARAEQTSGPKVDENADVFEQAGEGLRIRPAVETRHHPDLWPSQRGHNAAQVIRLDANIAVGDQQHVVFRFRVHVLQIGDLGVVAEFVRRDHESDVAFGKIGDQAADDRRGRIALFTDAEDDLVFGIILPAEAGEIFIGLGVRSANRLEDRRWRGVVQTQRALPAPVGEPEQPGRDCDQIVDDRGDDADKQHGAQPEQRPERDRRPRLPRLPRLIDQLIGRKLRVEQSETIRLIGF